MLVLMLIRSFDWWKRGRIIGHFDPDLMRTYQKQYGGRSVRHLVYHRVEESWHRELTQKCHSARAYVPMLMLMRWWKPGFSSFNRRQNNMWEWTILGNNITNHLRYVHTVPESFCAAVKTIRDRAFCSHTRRVVARDFCDGAKLRRVDF